VVYDAHEIWPDRNGRPEARWWLLACEALFVRVADAVVTASPGFADVMSRRYRIPRPEVILNVPPRPAGAAPERESGAGTVVYAGALTAHRGLEQAIAALRAVPQARLRLLGPGHAAFRDGLLSRAERLGVGDRVEILPAVPPAKVVEALRDADAGLALFQPVCLSHELVAPNKLFEYMVAGLPVVGSDLPFIAGFLGEWRFGVAVAPDDAHAIAAGLRAVLDPERNRAFRAAAARAAQETTWEREGRRLAAVYVRAAR
jgi:glycosyltransferase involved in cell wall biosynthesis